MKIKLTYFLLAFLLFTFIACNRTNSKPRTSIESPPFSIICNNMIHTPGEGVDSQVGTVDCDGIVLHYDFGRYGNSKPLSNYETFAKSFYAYHYSKFFEAIYIEEKVRGILRDSVKISEVVDYKLDDKYIVDCPNCDGTAKLIFNENEFLYGYIINENSRQNHKEYSIQINRMAQEYYRKIYYSNTNEKSGVYIAPTGNPSKSRLKNKLSIISHHKKNPQLVKIFEGILIN